MKLFFRKSGEGKPLFILHGLFGMSDNWMTLSKRFAENGFVVYAIDARNHGRSPHNDDFNYPVMSDDIRQLIDKEDLSEVSIIGHSMGGKTAMWFACQHPQLVSRLVVSDISPRYYEPHHKSILAAIHAVKLDEINTRKEAEARLREILHEESTVQFLLKNLYWNDAQQLAWRFNLASIEKNILRVGDALPEKYRFNGNALFLRGERSGYVSDTDVVQIKNHFSAALIETVAGAGHWIHAENPDDFYAIVTDFFR